MSQDLLVFQAATQCTWVRLDQLVRLEWLERQAYKAYLDQPQDIKALLDNKELLDRSAIPAL
jgi:hypothetical protein